MKDGATASIIWTSRERGIAFFNNDGNIAYTITEDEGWTFSEPVDLTHGRNAECFDVRYGLWQQFGMITPLLFPAIALVVGSMTKLDVIQLEPDTLEVIDSYENGMSLIPIDVSIEILSDGNLSIITEHDEYSFLENRIDRLTNNSGDDDDLYRGCEEARQELNLKAICCGSCHNEEADGYGELYELTEGGKAYFICCTMRSHH